MGGDMLLEIAKNMQGRYNCLKEIAEYTDQAMDAFSRNDPRSAGLILSMRAESMERADLYREKIDRILQPLDVWEVEKVRCLLRGQEPREDFEEEEKAPARILLTTAERFRRLLSNTIKKDEALNRRIAGKASIYRKD